MGRHSSGRAQRTCAGRCSVFEVAKCAPDFFDARYEIISQSGCWIWTGAVTEHGYGRFPLRLGNKRAHRFSFERFVRPLQPGEDVCHRCDVRCCVNPEHLWAGSRGDNNRDREAKGRGRQPRGESHHKAKLTRQQAVEIFLSCAPDRALSEKYGVTPKAIYAIKNRQSWAEDTRDLTAPAVKSAPGGSGEPKKAKKQDEPVCQF